MTEPAGELFDIGYQSYDGPREGRMRARRAVWSNGVRIALGLGRPLTAKILPWAYIGFASLMAVVFTIIFTLGGDLTDLPGTSGYYQVVSFLLFLFGAVVAPELLCPDRRDGVISLYLVRPLTSTDYLAARWLSFFAVTLAILYFGQTILFVGFTLAADDSWTYLKANWQDVPRFLAAGAVFAAFATTLPLAAAAFTNRRAYAAAFVIGLYLVSSVTAAALTDCGDEFREEQERFGGPVRAECNRLTGDAAKWYNLIGIVQAPVHLNDVIFDRDNDGMSLQLLDELPAGVTVGWFALLIVVPGGVLWWRYRGQGL